MSEKELRLEVFHGTDNKSAELILKTKKYEKSDNEDDWLGSGIYFYDNLDNAILYNIRQYINKNKEYPTYEKLISQRSILINTIECNEDEIVDFNEFENLQKLLILWKMFYDRVKKSSKYNNLKYKDGYIINWLCKHTDYFKGAKIFKNTFNLDIRFNKNVSDIFKGKSRIGYMIAQVFICVIDDSCIKDIKLLNNNYENDYTTIKDVINNLLMEINENEI